MDHWRGIGCKKCSDKLKGLNKKYSLDQIKNILEKIHPNISFDYNGYFNTNSKIKAICKEHGIFEKTVSLFLKNKGCEECNGTKKGKITKEYFLRKAYKKHNNYYDYSLVIIKKAQDKVKIICPKHGLFEQSPNQHLNGQGCPVCNFSKGELKILIYLKNNNINYLHQFKFKDCKHKRQLSFDFYLPEHNGCV